MKEKGKDIEASLMANKDFRDWVLNPSEDRNMYWEKWIQAHQEHKESVIKVRNSILKLKFKEDHLDEGELEKILDNVISSRQSVRHPRLVPATHLNLNWWLKIAASLLIVTFTIYSFRYILKESFNNSSAQHVVAIKTAYNPEGRKSRIRLSDGSVVNLNAGSTLVFPEVFSDTLRVVELKGEAFFDVAKNENRPFIVKTNNIETEVLGTTFNIRAFEEETEINVSLVTGKVKVTGRSDDTGDNVLFPGEKITYNKSEDTYVKGHFDLTEETGWKEEILVFNNTDFPKFITSLERWYGVKIDVIDAPKKKWSVNGHFKNESLEEVLIGVQFTYDIDYEIENKHVILKCNNL